MSVEPLYDFKGKVDDAYEQELDFEVIGNN